MIGNLIEFCHKLRLAHRSRLPDRRRDPHLVLQVFDRPNQAIDLLVFRLAAQVQIVRNPGIAPLRIGIFVLGEGGLLERSIRGVIADHVGDHQRIGQAVGDVERRADFVGDRVANPQEPVGKGQPRHGGCVVHFFAGFRIVRALMIGGGQIFECEPDCL